MAFSGNLKDVGLSELFSLLGQQGKSGTLVLKRGSQRAILEIQKGKITEITLDKKTPESTVKDVLVYTQRIEEKLFSDLRAAAFRTQKNFSQLLVEKNVLTEQERISWFKIAMEDMVFELFNWKAGEYVFETSNSFNPSPFEEMELDLDYVILEGMRRVDEWPKLNRKFPSRWAVFKVTEPNYGEYDLGEASDVIEKLDGKKSIEDISKELPFGLFRLYFHLSELWSQEFIAPAQQGKNMSKLLKQSQANIIVNNSYQWVLTLLICVCVLGAGLAFRFQVSGKFYLSQSALYEINRQQNMEILERALIDYLAAGSSIPRNIKELRAAGYLIPRLSTQDFQFVLQKNIQSFKLEESSEIIRSN